MDYLEVFKEKIPRPGYGLSISDGGLKVTVHLSVDEARDLLRELQGRLTEYDDQGAIA